METGQINITKPFLLSVVTVIRKVKREVKKKERRFIGL
jgi:hypothetical protein